MIECVFTIDYEIYGNGDGSLKELIFEPASKMIEIFKKYDSRFVAFIELAELEMIDLNKSDPAIKIIKRQIQELYSDKFEIGLHLHPQWYNAQYQDGKWSLDYNEYNMCSLTSERIEQIIVRSIDYLRKVLGDAEFTPFSFRAGNWLFQPTETLAKILEVHGIKVDSSVFKGGLQRNHGLDYRPACKNGYYWPFKEDVNIKDDDGQLIELPTYSVMVPFWKMVTLKRVAKSRKIPSSSLRGLEKFTRYLDFLRFSYPLKMDFCRMSLKELTEMMDKLIHEDQGNPSIFRPVVAIGHTKDFIDFEVVEEFMNYLRARCIPVSTFTELYHRCRQ